MQRRGTANPHLAVKRFEKREVTFFGGGGSNR